METDKLPAKQRERIKFLVYDESDVQNVAEAMGYNPLTEKRILQIKENICFSDSVFDDIDRDIQEAIKYVMENMTDSQRLREDDTESNG